MMERICIWSYISTEKISIEIPYEKQKFDMSKYEEWELERQVRAEYIYN